MRTRIRCIQSRQRISYLGDIHGSRSGIQLRVEQPVGARQGLQFRHAAVRVVQVAEHNGLGRTALLAGGLNFAVVEGAVAFALRRDPRVFDPLDAVGAFFHDAAHPHRHLRVLLHPEQLGKRLAEEVGFVERFEHAAIVVEEVEAAHFVGTVVGTIARAHAAVVGHHVEAFLAVRGRGDGTHFFARRVFALHAQHGLVHRSRGLRRFAEIAVDADPVHLAPQKDLLLADDGDIVFRLAGRHARPAAGAGRQIDGHAPAVAIMGRHTGCRGIALRAAVEAVRVEDRQRGRLLNPQRRIAAILGQRSLADQLGDPFFKSPFADRIDDMLLHGGQRISLTRRRRADVRPPSHA